MRALDLFAGPGGWDVAAAELGIHPLGIELDDAACATRKAAGHRTLQGDVAALDPADFAPCDLLIASPPCQAWSMAGKRKGRDDIQAVYAVTNYIASGNPDDLLEDYEWQDERSRLVTEPLRWALALRPRFIALEQVPPVLDYWKHIAEILRDEGYGVWTGILEAERYGVPQTRERAILVAELDGNPHPPAPTHQRYIPGEPQWSEPKGNLLGTLLPWVSMEDVLGPDWPAIPAPTVTAGGTDTGGAEVFAHGGRERIRRARLVSGNTVNGGDRAERHLNEPCLTITSRADNCRWAYDRRQGNTLASGERVPVALRSIDSPAPTIGSDGLATGRDVWRDPSDPEATVSNGRAHRVSAAEAAVFQAFPASYPWQGNKGERHRQIGNAVPPPLARAVLTELCASALPQERKEAA